jgi:5,10-methenyltetrahydrofolate synthetase
VPRSALRLQLLARREQFVSGSALAAAQTALHQHLAATLVQLQPSILGLYWAVRCEFNAVPVLTADPDADRIAWALPYASRSPREMHYRQWDRQAPTVTDDCGIPSSNGAPVVPDVVLVPCVGFTRQGYRLGYGGGYFDRWLAAHPQVTAVGVAWSVGEIDAGRFDAQSHDRPLTLVVTDAGVI